MGYTCHDIEKYAGAFSALLFGFVFEWIGIGFTIAMCILMISIAFIFACGTFGCFGWFRICYKSLAHQANVIGCLS
jgi:hypothetical protein